MAVGYNPTVVTSGLQLYYDMNNTVKSWKGQPATNQVTYPYADWTGSAFSLSYNYDQSGGATQTYVTGVSNPVNSPGIFRYFTGTTGYKYWAFRTTVPSAGTYTFSYYARLSAGSPNTIGMAQLWRDTDATDRTPTGNWNPTFTSNWARYTATATVTTYLDMFICHANPMTGGIQLDLCGFQLESGTYATPFVAGSRSTTTALADTISANTITTSSLTYVSSNTFSFTTASSNYITLPSIATAGNAARSMFCWINVTTGGCFISTGTASDSNAFNLVNYGSGYVGVMGYNNDYYPSSGTAIVNTGWKYIGATYDGAGTLRTYVNGVQDNVSTGRSYSTTGQNNFAGKSNHVGSESYISGSMPVVQIYNTALTADQVAQNFQALRGRYSI